MRDDQCKEEPMTDTQSGRYLTFYMESEVYGIEICFVKEIVGIQQINTIPECPDYVKGIINLRGRIIPIYDMRLRLHKEPIDYDDRTCIIVVESGDAMIGLIVDSVSEVVSIDQENISEPLSFNTGWHDRFISGIAKLEKSITLLIDCKKLIAKDAAEEIETPQQALECLPVLESSHI